METYIALLRGINVGGKTVKMERLRTVLGALGFEQVKTLLASGNVVFNCTAEPVDSLRPRIEAALKDEFGFSIPVLLRTAAQLHDLIGHDPFVGITVTPETRLYVTFIGDTRQEPATFPPFPDESVRIVRNTATEVCTAVQLTDGRGTLDLMASLEQVLGKNITTRNWNTVQKIAAVLSAQ